LDHLEQDQEEDMANEAVAETHLWKLLAVVLRLMVIIQFTLLQDRELFVFLN
jgi:hypothetical protein